MHLIRALTFLIVLLTAAPAQDQRPPILFQNPATLPAEAWTFVGLPARHQPADEAGWLSDETERWPWVAHEGGIYVLARLDAGELRKLFFSSKPREPEPFAWHPTLAQDLLASAPSWTLGTEAPTATSLDIVRLTPAVLQARFQAHWAPRKITVECWATVRSGCSTVEWASHAIYGTVANDGQTQTTTAPALWMVCRSRPWPDFAVRNGMAPTAEWADGTWRLKLVPEGTRWHRASRFASRGVICPVPDRAREQGKPIGGIYTGWDGEWLGLGYVPVTTLDTPRQLNELRAAYQQQRPGSYAQQRPRSQPRNAGQTGEQSDFGVASDLGVTAMEPWELHDGLWQVEGSAQRPTANREPNGEPMNADLHGLAETYGQRPDLNFGERDRLGWPAINRIEWIPSPATVEWTTEDDQHRSSGLICAVFALTRDEAVRRIIADQIELDRLDTLTKNPRLQAPRGVGRTALARANYVMLGFERAVMPLRRQLDAALAQAPISTLPASAKVRTLGGFDQAKYGWSYSTNGQPVIGWQGWQEQLAAIGLAAAGLRLSEPRYTQAARTLATTVTTESWQLRGGRLLHAYAIASTPTGTPWPASAWPATPNAGAEAWNDCVYISGAADYWTAGAAWLCPSDTPNAAAVKAAWAQPRNAQQARWLALRPR
jgi:hypothetical protein